MLFYRLVTKVCSFVCLMVLNATSNNMSAISWRSALLVEETGVPGENHRPVANKRNVLPHSDHTSYIEFNYFLL